ncbi:uncharacterized protein LOC129762940 [Toxorhynchites rutilus septentrionalis]|uniref:uncharacterized protein LOC129762940 n=1 Tax=Toxorhynchites rutilus septentrionalis TaxID=329112 RepID=UPI0024785A3A|nr:uncharacterized protein LOC129762940 [Toxorhynchites rutilus septentrionalis]
MNINEVYNLVDLEMLGFNDLGVSADFVMTVLQCVLATGTCTEEPLTYILSTTIEEDYLREEFARSLSEFFWTDEEEIIKPTLSIPVLRERVSAFAWAGTTLCDLLEPEMPFSELQYSEPRIAIDYSKVRLRNLRTAEDSLGPSTSGTRMLTSKRSESFEDFGLGPSSCKKSRLLEPSLSGIQIVSPFGEKFLPLESSSKAPMRSMLLELAYNADSRSSPCCKQSHVLESSANESDTSLSDEQPR